MGVGVDPLGLLNARFVLSEGKSLSIRWDPRETEDCDSEVLLSLSIDQHGATPTRLLCHFEDTGNATVSSEMITELLAQGITGYPNAQLVRRTVDHGEVPDGCMELVIGSERTPKVAISGYTPCSSPNDCPEDQTCNILLERCE